MYYFNPNEVFAVDPIEPDSYLAPIMPDEIPPGDAICSQCFGNHHWLVRGKNHDGHDWTVVASCRHCFGQGYLSTVPSRPWPPPTTQELRAYYDRLLEKASDRGPAWDHYRDRYATAIARLTDTPTNPHTSHPPLNG